MTDKQSTAVIEVSGVQWASSKNVAEAVLSRRPGVLEVDANPVAKTATVTYDPSQISYGRLLTVFFAVAHDPTQLNRQGPDEGPQYRSSIFAANEEQRAWT